MGACGPTRSMATFSRGPGGAAAVDRRCSTCQESSLVSSISCTSLLSATHQRVNDGDAITTCSEALLYFSAQRLRKIFLLSACVWFTFFIVFYCIKMVPQVKCLKMYWVRRLMPTAVLIPPVLSPWWETIYVGFSVIPPRLLYAKIE